MLKIIFRDNLLFVENNPAMILVDPPLELPLGSEKSSGTSRGLSRRTHSPALRVLV
jgi:hypothetical protein